MHKEPIITNAAFDIAVDKDLFLINAETGSLYFAGGGTYAQIPAIDGHEDFIYIAGGGEAIGSNGTKRLLLQLLHLTKVIKYLTCLTILDK